MSTAEHDTALRATLAGLRDLLRPRVRLQLADDERLDGRTALITGGNRGLGFGIAELLARRGARLILACRSGGDEAAARLRAITGNQAIEALQVDVSERASVAALVATLAERGESLDRVILNAAVVASESRTTSAGLDVMFHVNFLAVVDLVEQLLARGLISCRGSGSEPEHPPQNASHSGGPPGPPATLRAATRAPARIVVVSSEAHRSGKPALDRFSEPERYGTSGSLAHYGRSKLYLTSYAWALASTLDPDAIGVFTLCPGAVATDLAREAPRWMRVLLDPAMKRLFQDPLVAAEPVAWLSCARELDGQTQRYYHMHTRKQPAAWVTAAGNAELVRTRARELLETL